MMMLLTPAEMYRALVERDQSFEGLFFACVRTTGIFCRPTCHARKPKPENVEFASTIQEALHRGYRPCRVCAPMSAAAAAPNWLAPLVDEMLRQPDLRLRDDDLRVRGLDPVQVRRTFKRSFGMTFQAYQRACRLGTAMRSLHDGAPTLDAGLDAGFESDSGFRAAFARVFGEPPDMALWKANDPLDWATRADAATVPALSFDCGDHDRYGLNAGHEELHRRLEARRIPHEFALQPGDHGYEYVLSRLPASLAFLSKNIATK